MAIPLGSTLRRTMVTRQVTFFRRVMPREIFSFKNRPGQTVFQLEPYLIRIKSIKKKFVLWKQTFSHKELSEIT